MRKIAKYLVRAYIIHWVGIKPEYIETGYTLSKITEDNDKDYERKHHLKLILGWEQITDIKMSVIGIYSSWWRIKRQTT